MVFSVALRLVGDRGLAEEVAQDVFLELHHWLPRLESADHVRNWLRRVATHRSTEAPHLTNLVIVAPAEDPQVKDSLMDGLDKLGALAKERNEINLDKNMMSLVGSRKGSRYADLSTKMDYIVVRNYEFASKGQYQPSDLEPLRKKLDGNGWSHMVRNESATETNDIVIKTDSEGFLSDMVILNAEAKELNIVHMHGHFRMEDVNGAMGAAMGMSAGTFGMAGAMGSASHSSHHDSTPPTPPTPPKPVAAPAAPALKGR